MKRNAPEPCEEGGTDPIDMEFLLGADSVAAGSAASAFSLFAFFPSSFFAVALNLKRPILGNLIRKNDKKGILWLQRQVRSKKVNLQEGPVGMPGKMYRELVCIQKKARNQVTSLGGQGLRSRSVVFDMVAPPP